MKNAKMWFQEKKKLLKILKNECPMESDIHGIDHFQRVEQLGSHLCGKNHADKTVVRYFAYLHDCMRIQDGEDERHGARAESFVQSLYAQGLLALSQQQKELLCYAVREHHLDNACSDDITIQTCWDADRLDLWRIDCRPDPERLFTDVAKKQETIDFARRLYMKKAVQFCGLLLEIDKRMNRFSGSIIRRKDL